ncbi:MBL fold metallo-hydrolase [Celerinatantimonas sp. YJH-8]|uniref:MBL fold metallo-hydrolase n=1 Tax=Celerinatantimonas sp. YJH-8 TaxID=3228714 RepID=UPI0038CA90A0
MTRSTLPQLRIGEFMVTGLSDGKLTADLAVLSNIEKDEAQRRLVAAGAQDPSSININCFLIEGKGKTILIDSGAGGLNHWGGLLNEQLACCNIKPDDIDMILLTHAHPDHIGGLLTNAEAPTFPNATLIMHQNEYAFWSDDATFVQANERAQRNFIFARKVFAHYKDQIKIIEGGEIFPDLHAVPLPGHTPGHTGYMICSGGQQLLIWGDIVHFPDIQIADPDVAIAFDNDKVAAIQTRKNILKSVSADKILVAGMHFGQLAFAYIAEHQGQFLIQYHHR